MHFCRKSGAAAAAAAAFMNRQVAILHGAVHSHGAV
jgi:hypothetical protein